MGKPLSKAQKLRNAQDKARNYFLKLASRCAAPNGVSVTAQGKTPFQECYRERDGAGPMIMRMNDGRGQITFVCTKDIPKSSEVLRLSQLMNEIEAHYET